MKGREDAGKARIMTPIRWWAFETRRATRRPGDLRRAARQLVPNRHVRASADMHAPRHSATTRRVLPRATRRACVEDGLPLGRALGRP